MTERPPALLGIVLDIRCSHRRLLLTVDFVTIVHGSRVHALLPVIVDTTFQPHLVLWLRLQLHDHQDHGDTKKKPIDTNYLHHGHETLTQTATKRSMTTATTAHDGSFLGVLVLMLLVMHTQRLASRYDQIAYNINIAHHRAVFDGWMDNVDPITMTMALVSLFVLLLLLLLIEIAIPA